MKRLTVHSKVEKVNVEGKSKIFNTKSFRVKSSEKEINDILGSIPNVQKHYLSNIN